MLTYISNLVHFAWAQRIESRCFANPGAIGCTLILEAFSKTRTQNFSPPGEWKITFMFWRRCRRRCRFRKQSVR